MAFCFSDVLYCLDASYSQTAIENDFKNDSGAGLDSIEVVLADL